MEFLEKHYLEILLAGLFAALIPALVYYFSLGKPLLDLYLTARRTGLRAIYARTDTRAKDQLETMLDVAILGDEIPIVGRTHHGLLKHSTDLVAKALLRGCSAPQN